MASTTLDLSWSGQYAVDSSQRTSTLPPGDKIILPPSALEGLLSAAATLSSLSADDDDDNAEDNGPSTSTFDPFNPYSFAAERAARAAQQYQRRQQRQQQLPHPLTFRLVNPANERVVYAGIREFSAEEEHIVLSSFLRHALGVEDVQSNHDQDNATGPRITVHAKQLPKGTSVRLRPLEAGYDIEDWKSLLEQHLRTNFTTLTNGEVLTIPGGVGQPQRGNETSEYRFLIDKVEPAGEGICIVDTDLEVDIEPLNEEQARETLQRRLANATSTQNAQNGHTSSSKGGELKIGQSQDGNVQEDQYVDYQITNWDRSKDLEIELDVLNDGDDDGKNEIDLFLSPLSAKQRARPREDEHSRRFGYLYINTSSPKATPHQPAR
ncbi:MAG: hypothetical protein M1823_000212 [Watsoniomyces obsoletus]|nr:MAG: hypothetical protein M1823_000212 [Watsoniomyces obsoletus]